MINKGVATFGLDYGTCPRWLFERMVRLGREMIEIIIEEYGEDEFIRRLGDPVWFQSLGTVLAFDWNASGLTTILTAALKEAIRNEEEKLGIFICGGKGKSSLKTPQEIEEHSEAAGIENTNTQSLVYNSKMAAKVDSSLLQDQFQIYHHSFFFSKNGVWTIVQQGMNASSQTARRYHWHSEKAKDLINEPHSGISSAITVPSIDLTSTQSRKNRKISSELIQQGYKPLMKDIQLLRKHSSKLSQMVSLNQKGQQLTFLNLEDKEFSHHPLINEDFSKSKYLDKILRRVCEEKPRGYEKLLSLKGVGPKTIRALSLVSEMIYKAPPSYKDPARYSFAHGGKDSTPRPVDLEEYDNSINFFYHVIKKMKPNSKNKLNLNLLTKQNNPNKNPY